ILSQILSYLPVVDILACKATCNSFRLWLDDDIQLRQYCTLIRENGLVDTPPPEGLHINSRQLVNLNTPGEPLAQLHFEHNNRLVSSTDWFIVDGFFVELFSLSIPQRYCSYHYLNLHSSSMQQEGICSVRLFDLPPGHAQPICMSIAFAIEQSNLTAVISRDSPSRGPAALALHLVDFSHGGPHPLAAIPIIRMLGANPHAKAQIQIFGDHILAIIMGHHSDGYVERISLVHWRSGSVKVLRETGKHKMGYAPCLIVVSPDIVALVREAPENALELCKLDTTSSTLKTLRVLELPPVHDTVELRPYGTSHSMSTQFIADPPALDSARLRRASRGLFHYDPAQSIICINISYQRDPGTTPPSMSYTQPVSFVIHRRALLGLSTGAGRPSLSRLTWDEWGIRHCHIRAIPMWSGDYRVTYGNPISGELMCMRYFSPRLWVDFNPHRIRRAGGGGKVVEQNTMEFDGIFVKSVVSALPFRETQVKQPGPAQDVCVGVNHVVRVEVSGPSSVLRQNSMLSSGPTGSAW
ncbi:hypothetical protein BC834DRAFT_871944, partial [Gloeopeniophorella convolvens]